LSRYGSFDDPYCFKGSSVLKNLHDIRDWNELERLETILVASRLSEPFPKGSFNSAHYRALHHHLFQDIYNWAGQYRTIRIAKNEAMFCYPEHIQGQMDALFPMLSEPAFQPGAARGTFIPAAAQFLADLNAIHPFREGNGRTQLSFLFLLGERAKCHLDMTRIRPEATMAAMVESFNGRLLALEAEIERLLE
jgi:cell filamentation protein